MLICAMLFVLVIDGLLFVYAVIKPTLHTYILPTSFLSFLCLNGGLADNSPECCIPAYLISPQSFKLCYMCMRKYSPFPL